MKLTMKKTKFSAIAIAAALMIGSGVAKAQILDWADGGWSPIADGDQSHLFDFSGVDLTFQDEFLFQVIVDPNNDTMFSGADSIIEAGQAGRGWGVGDEAWMYGSTTADYKTSDDIVLGEANWNPSFFGQPFAGLPNTTTTLQGEDGTQYWDTTFYFRWFNASSVEQATEAGVIYNAKWRTPALADPPTPVPAASLNYYLAGNEGSEIVGDGWQSMPMVPEPGTFALFAIGLLTVAARRRKSSKLA